MGEREPAMTTQDVCPKCEESAAEAAACIAFIKNEIVWLEFRDDFQMSDCAEQKNLVKLKQFVEGTGFGFEILNRIRELEAALSESEASVKHFRDAYVEECYMTYAVEEWHAGRITTEQLRLQAAMFYDDETRGG